VFDPGDPHGSFKGALQQLRLPAGASPEQADPLKWRAADRRLAGGVTSFYCHKGRADRGPAPNTASPIRTKTVLIDLDGVEVMTKVSDRSKLRTWPRLPQRGRASSVAG